MKEKGLFAAISTCRRPLSTISMH